MITISICLSDIPAEARKQGKNGKWYADFVVDSRRESDQYGNTHSVSISQSKEEREAKKPKVYIGNGKEYVFQKTETPAPTTPVSDETDDLPF